MPRRPCLSSSWLAWFPAPPNARMVALILSELIMDGSKIDDFCSPCAATASVSSDFTISFDCLAPPLLCPFFPYPPLHPQQAKYPPLHILYETKNITKAEPRAAAPATTEFICHVPGFIQENSSPGAGVVVAAAVVVVDDGADIPAPVFEKFE